MARLCKIKASAGSGKTHTLTRRYLNLLVSCQLRGAGSACSLNWETMPSCAGDILAVTFTNAAVTELRERVLQDLKKTALGRMEIEGLAPNAARVCLENLLLNMGEMNIRTIDSLLYQITRSAALNLGLAPDFQPSYSTADVFSPYLEKFLRMAEAGEGDARMLLEKVVALALESESWKSEKKKSFLPPACLMRRMECYLDDIFLAEGRQLANAGDVRGELEERRRAAIATCAAFLDLLNEFMAGAGDVLKLHGTVKIENRLRDVINGNFSKDATFKLPDNVAGIFTVASLKKYGRIPQHLEDAYNEAHEAVASLGAIWKPFTDYLRNEPVIVLAKKLYREFIQDMPSGKSIPSPMIAHFAQKAMKIENGICDALCHMGNRLTHFLVDEFQDTSEEQWVGIRPFVEDALARGGSLTWVGDVKQSIYAWRNAAPELFDKVRNDVCPGGDDGDDNPVELDVNRRSREVIVNFNNSLFARLAEKDYAKEILSSLLPPKKHPEALAMACQLVPPAYEGCVQKVVPSGREGGYVRIELLGQDDGAFVAGFPARLIEVLNNEIRPRRKWSDVMVLVRSNTEATELAAALVAEKIPVVTENSLLLASHPLIRQIVAFLTFLDNPLNEVAFLTLVNGSIFRSRDDASNLPSAAELGLMKRGENLFAFFRESYAGLWKKYLEPFYDQSTLLTAYDATREWYRIMEVEARFGDETLFLRSFLEILQNAEAEGMASIPGFLKFWAERGGKAKAHTPENIDAVRIMTMHKAKGLQSPVVIVPLPGRSMSLKTNKSSSHITKKIGGFLLQVPFRTIYKPEYPNALARDAREAINLLYVAFTRAAEELYIFTPETEGTLLRALLENAGIDHRQPLGAQLAPCPGRDEKSPEMEMSANGLPERAAPDMRPMAWMPKIRIARNRLPKSRFAPEERGTFLHFCLENMHFTGNAGDDARKCLEFGLSHSGIDVPADDETASGLMKSLEWYASHADAAAWTSEGWPEQPVMDANGNEMRVDLLVPQPWGVLVIDYKSGSPAPEHVEQIQRYLKCVEEQAMFPGIARGLLVYLDERMFHLVSGAGAGRKTSECPELPGSGL